MRYVTEKKNNFWQNREKLFLIRLKIPLKVNREFNEKNCKDSLHKTAPLLVFILVYYIIFDFLNWFFLNTNFFLFAFAISFRRDILKLTILEVVFLLTMSFLVVQPIYVEVVFEFSNRVASHKPEIG